MRNGKPLKLSTLYQKFGRRGMTLLGFQDYIDKKSELPPKQEKIVQKSLNIIEEAETSFAEDPIESISETNFGLDKKI